MLIVGWFQNFKTPMVMMMAIPLSLVGIVFGHWLLGAFFTATSFIGMIALAGVMVRELGIADRLYRNPTERWSSIKTSYYRSNFGNNL